MTRVKASTLASFAIVGSMSAAVHGADTSQGTAAPFGAPVDDQRVFAHALLEELEYRAAASTSLFRWESEAWLGTDTNRLWLKSEGEVDRHDDVMDGEQELLYDRPISSFFDLQTGVRLDLDSAPQRSWVALGIEGIAPYFVQLSATAYASDDSHLAAKVQGSYDLLLTQRLIVQPRLELNAYSRADPRRQLGSGVSDIDAGIRWRYEIRRKFAPYLGLSYQHSFSQTAQYARAAGNTGESLQVLIGLRAWL